MAPAAQRRGADRDRPAVGGLRSGARSRPDRDRRGARRVLQARGRPALRRAARGGAARRARDGAAARGLRDAAAGDAGTRCRGSRCSERVGSRPLPPVRRARHARRAPPAASGHAPGARAPRARRSCCSTGAAGRTSSPAAHAGRSGSARSATSRSCCTAPSRRSRAITAATASASRNAATRAARRRSRATARAPSGSRTSSRDALDVPVFRLDADTAGAKDAVPALLARFSAAPAGVLVGTQMVAKGHDFPDVTLGVVVDADATLRFPDFRAEERTFALIAQLAGRAGRGPRGGRVLVQTTAPDAPAIVAAARHDARRVPRRRARAPPRARLPAVRGPHPGRLLVRRPAARRAPRPARSREGRLAPAARRCWVRRRCSGCAGRERSQVVVKAHERAAAVAAVRAAVDRRRSGASIATSRSPSTSTRSDAGGGAPPAAVAGRFDPPWGSRRPGSRGGVVRIRAHGKTPGRARGGRRAGALTPRRRDSRAARCRAAARAQARRPGAAQPRARGRAVRRRTARPGPADGRADGRRARDRARGDAGRPHEPRAGLPRRPRRRRSPRSSIRCSSGRATSARRWRRAASACPECSSRSSGPCTPECAPATSTATSILIEASGLEARVIQHELDHLDGVLILDRTSREQRKEAMRTLRETAAAPLGASA